MAMTQIRNAINMIQTALMNLPIGSDVHRAANKAISDLSKHFPQGEGQDGAQQIGMQDQLRQMQRSAMLRRILQNAGGPSEMPPSTPIPGA